MICHDCIKPETLKEFISQKGVMRLCRYCDTEGVCIPSAELASYIEARFYESYKNTDELSDYEYTVTFDYGSDEIPIHTLDVIIVEHFDLGNQEFSDEVIEAIETRLLKPDESKYLTFFVDDGTQENNNYKKRWDNFAFEVSHGHRFFSDDARYFLDDLFELISPGGKILDSLILTLTEENSIYRARIVNDPRERVKINDDPVSGLGPAPRERTNSQRMTPEGISALYCAFERNTCLSELRPITGDMVISGAFYAGKTIKLLQLNQLNKVSRPNLNPLMPGFSDKSHAFEFLNKIIDKMSKPKRNSDRFGYLPTQVVFEYLRKKFKEQVDGVVYPSVQTGRAGTNLVLFPEFSELGEADNIYSDGKVEPKLLFRKESLIFHAIEKVQPVSNNYKDIAFVTLDELSRQRLGQHFGVIRDEEKKIE